MKNEEHRHRRLGACGLPAVSSPPSWQLSLHCLVPQGPAQPHPSHVYLSHCAFHPRWQPGCVRGGEAWMPCSAVTLSPEWGPGLKPGRAGIGQVLPRDALHRVWLTAAVPARAGSTTTVGAGWGEADSPGTGLSPTPNPGAEHALVLRLRSFLGTHLLLRVLWLEGGGPGACGPALTLPVSLPKGELY